MDQELTIAFTSQVPSSDLWVEARQVIESEIPTPDEVAELSDSFFDVNSCEESAEEEKEVVSEEEQIEAINNIIPLGICAFDTSNNYTTKVEIVRTPYNDPYEVRLSNGVVDETSIVRKTITENIVIDDASTHSLDYPVVEVLSLSWVDPFGRPEVLVTGRDLYWLERASGVIKITYTTEYDEIGVTVFADGDGGVGECNLICFCHFLVSSIELEAPEHNPEEAAGLCKSVIGYEGSSPKKDNKPQWETTRTTYKCECSGNQSRVVYSNEPDHWDKEMSAKLKAADVAKKEKDFAKEAALRAEASAIAAAHNKALTEYIFPGITVDVFGGYENCGEVDGDMNDPDFYEENCCEQPEVTLPKCRKVIRQNGGGASIDPATLASLQAQYGSKLKTVAVSPSDGDCGTTTTEQHMIPKNCCDFVFPVWFDDDSTPDVLPADNNIMVYWNAGRAPFTVRTTANHTSFDNGSKTQVTMSNWITLYADEDFCGATSISVDDGCSKVSLVIRSPEGEWVLVSEYSELGECEMPGCDGEEMSFDSGGYSFSGTGCVSGNKLQLETAVQILSSANPYGTNWTKGVKFIPHPLETNTTCGPGVGGPNCVSSGVDHYPYYCGCASDAGFPDVQTPPCGDVIVDINSGYYQWVADCSSTMWLMSSGSMSGACSYPGSVYSGAHTAVQVGWLEQSSLHNFQWQCI